MYLADTNVISETRLEERANEGVRVFFRQAKLDKRCVHLSVMTVAELGQGVERVRRRGDKRQAEKLESWVNNVLREYDTRILPAGKEIGRLWGNLRAPHPELALDKRIGATAIFHGFDGGHAQRQRLRANGRRDAESLRIGMNAARLAPDRPGTLKPTPPPSPSPPHRRYISSPPRASAHAPSTHRAASQESARPTHRSDARARTRRRSH